MGDGLAPAELTKMLNMSVAHGSNVGDFAQIHSELKTHGMLSGQQSAVGKATAKTLWRRLYLSHAKNTCNSLSLCHYRILILYGVPKAFLLLKYSGSLSSIRLHRHFFDRTVSVDL